MKFKIFLFLQLIICSILCANEKHQIASMYAEETIGWSETVAGVYLEDDSGYIFTDLSSWEELGTTHLSSGSIVYVYPMQPEEIFYRHKTHKANHWLEDEYGNRWRVWKAGSRVVWTPRESDSTSRGIIGNPNRGLILPPKSPH